MSKTTNQSAGKETEETPQPSLWKSAVDVWPFILLVVLAGLGSWVLHLSGQAYEQPNQFSMASVALLMTAGAAMIATAFGLVHLGTNRGATVVWVTGAVVAALLAALAFVVGGFAFSPSIILGLSLLACCVLGWWLGRKADAYRAQFPNRPKFLGEWE